MAENNFTDGYQFHDPNFNINLDAVNLTPSMEEQSGIGGFFGQALGGASKFLNSHKVLMAIWSEQVTKIPCMILDHESNATIEQCEAIESELFCAL